MILEYLSGKKVQQLNWLFISVYETVTYLDWLPNVEMPAVSSLILPSADLCRDKMASPVVSSVVSRSAKLQRKLRRNEQLPQKGFSSKIKKIHYVIK